jgi:hypothetical protein
LRMIPPFVLLSCSFLLRMNLASRITSSYSWAV